MNYYALSFFDPALEIGLGYDSCGNLPSFLIPTSITHLLIFYFCNIITNYSSNYQKGIVLRTYLWVSALSLNFFCIYLRFILPPLKIICLRLVTTVSRWRYMNDFENYSKGTINYRLEQTMNCRYTTLINL